MSKSITQETILKLAKLSKLNIDEKDIPKFTENFEQMLEFVNQINELNLSDENFGNNKEAVNNLREDEINPSLPQSEILQNVEGGENGFFYIKKGVI